MKRLFIVCALIGFTFYPPNDMDAKEINVKTVKRSIKEYEKIKHDILVHQFFMELQEVNHSINKIQKIINK